MLVVNTAELKGAIQTEIARVRRAGNSAGNPLIAEIYGKSAASLSKLLDFLETCPATVQIEIAKPAK